MVVPRILTPLDVNPPTGAVQHITVRGSDWLWAVFCIFIVFDLGFMAWMLCVPRGKRLFHQIAVMILTLTALTYFSQASNLGWTVTRTQFGHYTVAGTWRQIWWCRYVNWILTLPLLLVEITLASALPLSDIVILAFAGGFIWANLLVGALVQSSYKWGYYTFACVSMLYMWWVLIMPARKSAKVLRGDYHIIATVSAVWISFMYALYAVCWACCEGANVVSNDSEMVWYGILDILTKPCFLFYFLAALTDCDLAVLQLNSGKYTESGINRSTAATGEVVGDVEKSREPAVESPPLTKSFPGRGQHDVIPDTADTTVPTEQPTTVTTPPATAAQHTEPRYSGATLEGDVGHH